MVNKTSRKKHYKISKHDENLVKNMVLKKKVGFDVKQKTVEEKKKKTTSAIFRPRKAIQQRHATGSQVQEILSIDGEGEGRRLERVFFLGGEKTFFFGGGRVLCFLSFLEVFGKEFGGVLEGIDTVLGCFGVEFEVRALLEWFENAFPGCR